MTGLSGGSPGILLFAAACVFVQASVEEIESRAFVFGKMHGEGVPFVPALIASSFFFSYFHAANPGFGIAPFINVFLIGSLFVLSYHYFGSLWFLMAAHMIWNYMQDFIFGLPDSGRPAAVSFLNTTVLGSSFFYDKDFGIEGSGMAAVMSILGCLLIILIGRRMEQTS